MRVTNHGEFLTQLARWPRFFPVNVYLVREGDGLTLIDTGMSGRGEFIVETAKQIGLPITRIALTHSDPDHIGGLDELRKLLPDAEIYMTELSAKVLSGEVIIDKHGNIIEPRHRNKVTSAKPDHLLEPGDMLGSLRVVAAPGHKPDQIAFFDTRDNSLICGDAFQTKSGLAVAGVIRWTFPFPGLATVDKPTALETARHLRELEPSRIASGHGDVLEAPTDAIDQAVDEASRKIGGGVRNVA